MNARIALLPGDGIGPEVTDAAVRVLREVAARYGHTFEFHTAAIGGDAIDRTGAPLPPETVALCQAADAVLLGAVGGPKWDDPGAAVRPEQGLLGIRQALGLFANIRPVRAQPGVTDWTPFRTEIVEGVDLVVVRELTGGIYFGEKTRATLPDGGEVATDVCRYDTHEIERVTRVAAALARARGGRLTSVDKANVLETSRLWRRTVSRVIADEFPDLGLEHVLVDACAMHLIRRPRSFDVILTENMFGDILTDEAAMLVGSIGALPSASLGDERNAAGLPRGLYEPIHGSAPDIAGTGTADPTGAILSAAMLLRHSLGLAEEAAAVEAAVGAGLRALAGRGAGSDAVGASTQERTAAVLAALAGLPGRAPDPGGQAA